MKNIITEIERGIFDLALHRVGNRVRIGNGALPKARKLPVLVIQAATRKPAATDEAFCEDRPWGLDPAEEFAGICRRLVGQARCKDIRIGRGHVGAEVLLKAAPAVPVARADIDLPARSHADDRRCLEPIFAGENGAGEGQVVHGSVPIR